MLIRRFLGSLSGALAVTAAVVLCTAGPASAHVGVKADKAQAGATDVTITFDAENESSKASIVSVRVALPAGIAPADVAYVSGPAGWALTQAADGYTVAGPALAAKQGAKYAVKVAKLPADTTTLSFKTLVTYSDGRVDRWIDIPQQGTQPDNPAPTLTLAPAAAAPSSAATSSPAPAATASDSPTTATPATAAGGTSGDGGSSAAPWIIGAAVVVLLAGGAVAWRLRGGRRPAA
ncbi:DUF1775 domain-containing protein [Dactylosporangium sp. NPDC000555]|uniref:DUF1775 domain-containing protein n=1 Tax=Dactylosporangium sp. NPDC000555 TaxID=3154260 RepID=UPI0033325078